MTELFTEQARSRVVAAVRAGRTLAEASEEADGAHETVRGWLRKGRALPSSVYGPFAAEVDRARAASVSDGAVPPILAETRHAAAHGSVIDRIALPKLEDMYARGG